MAGEPAAAEVQAIAARLSEALAARPELSLRRLATISGAGRQAISDLLNGTVWPDVLTIIRLERALKVTLWGRGEGIRGCHIG